MSMSTWQFACGVLFCDKAVCASIHIHSMKNLDGWYRQFQVVEDRNYLVSASHSEKHLAASPVPHCAHALFSDE